MISTGVSRLLGDLLENYRASRGVDATRGGHSFVVSADGAAMFLREVFGSLRVPDVQIDDTPDTLFHYRRIPVRLRYLSSPGMCYVATDAELPERTCCDQASVASVVMALTVASA